MVRSLGKWIVMNSSLRNLSEIQFPCQTKEAHNRNMRLFLQEVAPLVERGTIQSIKREVHAALAMPPDDSRRFAEKHFWALQKSWPYVYWDNPRKPMPAERRAMYDLYEQIRSSGLYPFEDGDDAAPKPARTSPKA